MTQTDQAAFVALLLALGPERFFWFFAGYLRGTQDAPPPPAPLVETEVEDNSYSIYHTLRHLRMSNREVTEAVPGLLQRHGGMTYNQVATHLGIPYAQASAVLKVLADNPLSPIFLRQEKRSQRTHAVYHNAPDRKRINANRADTDKVVQEVILQHLWEVEGGASETAIQKHCVQVLLQISVPIVRRCLAALRTDGKVTTRPGAHNATIYSLAGL